MESSYLQAVRRRDGSFSSSAGGDKPDLERRREPGGHANCAHSPIQLLSPATAAFLDQDCQIKTVQCLFTHPNLLQAKNVGRERVSTHCIVVI